MASDTHTSSDLDRYLSLSPLPYVQAWRGFHARMRTLIEKTVQPEEEEILWPQMETKG